MITVHIIELVIVAIILIDLWYISKKVDDGLKFLKKEIEWQEKDMKVMHDMLFPEYTITTSHEPSFTSKVKNEEKRLKDISKCYKCDAPFQKHHKFNDVEGKFYHTNCIPKVATKKVKK